MNKSTLKKINLKAYPIESVVESRINWADFKRLVELIVSDTRNRKLFEASPDVFLQMVDLDLDISSAKEALYVYLGKQKKADKGNPYIRKWRDIFRLLDADTKQRIRPANFSSEAFYEWMERKKKALAWESVPARRALSHYIVPIMFELTTGCTGQCKFCCFSTQPLTDVYLYTDENQQFWREILQITREELGEVASVGGCYCATEPLDNPDYEKFIEDFYQVFQTYPQTTTVKAVEKTQRMKHFMEYLGPERLRMLKLRFSVVSLEQLAKIYQKYSKEELAYVELLMNNPESIRSYSYSGRAREIYEEMEEKTFGSFPTACLIGFLVNLCQKTISLVAPRRPSEQYPLGMEVIAIKNFSTSEEYRQMIDTMIQEYMPQTLSEHHRVRFHSRIEILCKGNTTTFSGESIKRVMSLSKEAQAVIQCLQEHDYVIGEIFQEKSFSQFLKESVMQKLQYLYELGFVEVV